MNILQIKCVVEVAKIGSMNKASEILNVAQPNLSRSIRELENELGITIFRRTNKGILLTNEGSTFLTYAEKIIEQFDEIDKIYNKEKVIKTRFSLSAPRVGYIADAFTIFSMSPTIPENAELFYRETNASRALNNITENDFSLGIIRFAKMYDPYFTKLLNDKNIHYELICEFNYVLVMSKDSPLSGKDDIRFKDLTNYIEIAHADPFVPSLPLAKVVKDELPNNIKKRIYIYDRASQYQLLSENKNTFMWVSPEPEKVMKKYGLIQKTSEENNKIYKDILIYKNDYQLSTLDKEFIKELNRSRDNIFLKRQK